MNELQAQLQEVTEKLAQLDPNNRDNLVEIASLEQKRDLLKLQIADEAAKTEQEQAQKVVIHQATVKAEYWLDNLEIEGLTMSQLSASDDAYKLMRAGIQSKLVELEQQALTDQRLQDIAQKDLQRQIEELQQSLKESESKHATFTQVKAERDDFESKLKNATDEIDRLNSHIDDLRKEISVGAREAYKVIDQTDQIKELADKIKASRIHVYDVVPDADFNPKNFSAKRADTGETVTYNWTTARNYIELKDEEEVQRFRQQHAEQSAVPDPTLDTPINVPTIPPVAEVTAPEVTFPITFPVHSGDTVDQGLSSPDGQSDATVSRQEFEALKATVMELCQVCDIAEVA